MEKHILSKSTFIRGSQCLKSLYLNKRRPFLRDRLSQEQIAIFQRGTKVGVIAQQLFPGGIDVRPKSPKLYQKAVADTLEQIAKGTPVIYEATFQHNGVLIMLDILAQENDKWFAYEVKSSLSVSETYLLDASVQYYVITNSGIQLEDFFIVHMNGDYVKNGEIDYNELFIKKSVKNTAAKNLNLVERQIEEQKEILNYQHSPKIEIGPHCSNPYPCDFHGHCWKGVPKNSIFDLTGMDINLQFELFKKGIHELGDLPDNYGLNPLQQKQIESVLNNNESANRDLLKKFIDELKQPVFILDILFFNPAIPVFDGTTPYQHIPFSFGLRELTDNDSGDSEVTIYFDESAGDPRLTLASSILQNLPAKGAIICFDGELLKNRLSDLKTQLNLPEGQIKKIINRLISIKDIFQKGLYFHPELKEEVSITQIANKVLHKQGGKIKSDFIASHSFQKYFSDQEKNMEQKILLKSYIKFKVNSISNFINHLKKLVSS